MTFNITAKNTLSAALLAAALITSAAPVFAEKNFSDAAKGAAAGAAIGYIINDGEGAANGAAIGALTCYAADCSNHNEDHHDHHDDDK